MTLMFFDSKTVVNGDVCAGLFFAGADCGRKILQRRQITPNLFLIEK